MAANYSAYQYESEAVVQLQHQEEAQLQSQSSPEASQSQSQQQHAVPSENVNEALYLFVIAAVGLTLNLCVIGCILSRKKLRKMTSAFIIHECLLDVIKSAYCVPFAWSLLRDVAPTFCTVLGGSYVVVVTASGFNIVAMICCEAYTFSEHHAGHEARGSASCVAFGVTMVYVGSVIIHLGPTIIGGDFQYNDPIGNCIFVYGTIKSYVVHAMWIAIMSLSMAGAVYYLAYFYRHVQANSAHRLTALVRTSIAVSRGQTVAADGGTSVRNMVRDALSRIRAFMTVTALFVVCWYPLFVLTLIDPRFRQPTKVYKLLTFVAWSNAALNPLVLVLFDRNLNAFARMECCTSGSRQRHGSNPDDEENPPLMGACAGSGGSRERLPGSTNSRSKQKKRLPSSSHYRSPATVYQRVGCRLCTEGQQWNPSLNRGANEGGNTQCNGGASNNPSFPRDSSICELHNLSMC